MERNILFVIAPQNFRDEEYLEPKQVLERHGFDVITTSKDVTIAKGSLGVEVQIDININDVNPSNYQAILFAGGPGAKTYFHDGKVHELIRQFFNEKKLVGAICIAPIILANSGILKNKSATVWNVNNKQALILVEKGAHYINRNVFQDGNIITANGPESAKEFGEKIVEYFG